MRNDARPEGGTARRGRRPGRTPPTGANEVRLVGRVTGPPEERWLPSGARLVSLRVTVRRSATVMTRGSAQAVDVLDCVAWSAEARRAVIARRVGDVVELHGAIRRRFFRTPGGSMSRVEVEVLSARLVEPAG